MNTPPPANPDQPFWKNIHWSVWCLITVGLALLIIDHWVHVLGALPYLVLLACPLVHFFMHGKHGHKHHQDTKREP
jgi:hypothetical protein